MATFDYALGYRLLNYTSDAAKRAGAAAGQPNEGQCATSVSAWAFWHGYSNATVLGNAKDRYANAKAAGYKVGSAVKPWSWICFGTGYYGKYGHIMAIYDVVGDYVYYAEANVTGDGKLSSDDMIVKKTLITNLTGRAGYQGCIYIGETFPKVKQINLDYNYSLTGQKTLIKKDVTYKTYYAADKSGVNYRLSPNGTVMGTYKYAEAVSVEVGSETTNGGSVWVKAKNNYWSVKNLLSTTKPSTDTYKTYYANDKSGVNYRATPNGKLVGTYAYGAAVSILVGSETTKDGGVWVKSKNGYWSLKSLLSTTNPIQYKTYYAADPKGVNYRKTPNGTIIGTYKYGQAVRILVGSETTSGGIVWVKAANNYWSAKNLLTTTKPKV